MRSLGVVFEPAFPPERLREVALSVEDAGVPQLWLWEDCFRESGIASAAAALAATTELTVAIGVLPMPLRNVALTAMELATLSRLFPGRIIGGVGHGVQSWMAQVGARHASPLTLMAEYLPTDAATDTVDISRKSKKGKAKANEKPNIPKNGLKPP